MQTFRASTLPAYLTHYRLDQVPIEVFKKRHFAKEIPTLITQRKDFTVSKQDIARPDCSIPAALRWFDDANGSITLSQKYLSPYSGTILPYELVIDSKPLSDEESLCHNRTLSHQLTETSSGASFQRFNAPLSLFLEACRSGSHQRLYIAQAQIADLPKELQADLPVPDLVLHAGKGDIYDANIWMGIPPTYTPLHKDPNPNLFVQLASYKRARLFEPSKGAAIFREVQSKLGQYSSSTFRGEEMMEGPERAALEEIVWGANSVDMDGLEALVGPGDALFIPKGWWHSFKSVGTGLNASVNWWFR